MTGRDTVRSYTFNLRAGSDGSVSSTQIIKGTLVQATIEYESSSAATTDVLVTGVVRGGPGSGVTVTYLNAPNNNTNVVLYPEDFGSSSSGTSSILVYMAFIPIDGVVTVAVSQQTAGKNTCVTLFVE